MLHILLHLKNSTHFAYSMASLQDAKVSEAMEHYAALIL